MPGRRKPAAGIFTAAVFILMEIAALCLVRSTDSLQNIWLNKISHHFSALTWGMGRTVRNYFSLEKQNERLALENLQLLNILQSCMEENDRLKSVAASDSIKKRDGFRYIPAVVTKIGWNSQHNHIIIDKGSEDGISPYSGIITGRGVVGIITAVDRHFSYGLTLMNDKIGVSAGIRGIEVNATLEWNGKSPDGARLRQIMTHQEINPGDTVETNGFSNLYPAGIPLGICGETHLIDGAEKCVDVTLFEDFSTLRYVVVAENLNLDEIKRLEDR